MPSIGTIDEMKKAEEKEVINAASISELAERLILEQYAPPFVIINEKYDILYYHGETDRYLVSERKRTFCKSARAIFSLPRDHFKI